jgi:hypothetical protein
MKPSRKKIAAAEVVDSAATAVVAADARTAGKRFHIGLGRRLQPSAPLFFA